MKLTSNVPYAVLKSGLFPVGPVGPDWQANKKWWSTDLVAVYPADPGVECLQELLLEVALFLPPSIIQIVGMDDADYVVKLVCPALTMMVPVEVLWLLKNGYISLACHRTQSAQHQPSCGCLVNQSINTYLLS